MYWTSVSFSPAANSRHVGSEVWKFSPTFTAQMRPSFRTSSRRNSWSSPKPCSKFWMYSTSTRVFSVRASSTASRTCGRQSAGMKRFRRSTRPSASNSRVFRRSLGSGEHTKLSAPAGGEETLTGNSQGQHCPHLFRKSLSRGLSNGSPPDTRLLLRLAAGTGSAQGAAAAELRGALICDRVPRALYRPTTERQTLTNCAQKGRLPVKGRVVRRAQQYCTTSRGFLEGQVRLCFVPPHMAHVQYFE